jgi:hypothetical protein
MFTTIWTLAAGAAEAAELRVIKTAKMAAEGK